MCWGGSIQTAVSIYLPNCVWGGWKTAQIRFIRSPWVLTVNRAYRKTVPLSDYGQMCLMSTLETDLCKPRQTVVACLPGGYWSFAQYTLLKLHLQCLKLRVRSSREVINLWPCFSWLLLGHSPSSDSRQLYNHNIACDESLKLLEMKVRCYLYTAAANRWSGRSDSHLISGPVLAKLALNETCL